MDGRCFSCASKFTIFRKECGCKSCGRSFCAGCLGFSAVLPAHGNAKQKICKKCHESVTSGKDERKNSSKWSPPENYKKRVAALEAKQQKVKPSGVGPGGADGKYEGLSAEDRAIAERLERLKQETKPANPRSVASTAEIESRVQALSRDTRGPVPSLQEMEERLAALQGRTPPSRAARPIPRPPDTRTDADKVEDLLTRLRDETDIDRRWDPDAQSHESGAVPPGDNDLGRVDGIDGYTGGDADAALLEREKDRIVREAAAELRDDNTREEKMLEIARRLAALQGKDPATVTVENIRLPDSDEETEEEGIQRILTQLAEESALDAANGYNIPPEDARVHAGNPRPPPATQRPPAQSQRVRPPAVKVDVADSDEEELPWCCICNENAVLRCHDCDDDLYCRRCFREGHDRSEQKEHHTSEYCPPAQRRKGR